MRNPATGPQLGSFFKLLFTLFIDLISGKGNKLAEIEHSAIQRVIDEKDKDKPGGLLDRVIEFLNRGCKVEAPTILAVVGTFLNKVKCYMGDNFEKWIATPGMFEMVVEQQPQALESFMLKKRMNDTELTEKTKNTPIGLPTFFYMAWLLISGRFEVFKQKFGQEIKQDGTWYVMHVQLPDRVVAVDFFWGGDRFRWNAYPLDYGIWWDVGHVFLFFATAEASAS